MSNDHDVIIAREDLILHRLGVLEAKLDENTKELVSMGKDISALKVKSGIWGALSGFVGALAILTGWFLGK